jgi:hypothetical protein
LNRNSSLRLCLRICLMVLVSYLMIALLLFVGGFLLAFCFEPGIKNLPVSSFLCFFLSYKIVSWRFFLMLAKYKKKYTTWISFTFCWYMNVWLFIL